MQRITLPGLVLVMVLPALALPAACGGNVATGPKPDYHNPAKGFALTFPKDWSIKEDQFGLDVIGLSPVEGPSDKFQDNVSVASSDMPSPMTPAAILDANIPAMINVITDFQPGPRGNGRLGDNDAAWLAYTQRQGVFQLSVTLYAFAGKKRAFLVYCTSETSARERFQPKCEAVVKSLRITP